jgi:hypothetical protein
VLRDETVQTGTDSAARLNGGRLGFRIIRGWVAGLFVNSTLGPQPVGNTIHGSVGLRVNY